MRQGKRPTMAQKLKLKSLGLIPENWLVSKDCPSCFMVAHRVSGETRTMPKRRKL